HFSSNHRLLHSFPTRRSSDLTAIRETLTAVKARYPTSRIWAIFEPRSATSRRNVFQKEFAHCFEKADRVVLCSIFAPEKLDASRSEEHTSELQSRSDLVCRLL